MKKMFVSLFVSLCLVFSLMPTASATTAFTDISDPVAARNVEVLRMLGVLNGVSETQFDPTGTLTRAQFTKMAIMAQNQGSRISTYQNYTIFPDVKSGHWAAGYINLAVRGEKKFISGFANGTFAPDQIITFGQAVTILMRLLDYKDADVGMIWPDGYLDTAAAIGLTKEVPLAAEDAICRSDAAQLFVNLLTTKKKDGTTTFAASIAASLEENIILLNANEKTSTGAPAFETTKGTYPLAGTYIPSLLSGRKGTLMLDASGKVMSFLPSNIGSIKEITVSSAKAGTLKDTAGNSYTMTSKIVAYERGESKTYGDVFINLRPGTQVTLHIGQNGKVEMLFIGDVAAEDAVVISKDGGGNFSLLTNRTDYSIYKGGEKVSASALRAYDVATYHAKENKIQISDTHVSGYYENAYPNTEAPGKITMLGNEFTVLPSAIPSLSQFQVGRNITLLLTADNQVAGAIDSEQVPGNAIGLATISGGTVKVTLPCGLILSGKTDGDIASFDGQLVTVTSKKSGVLSVYPVKQKETKDSLNVPKRLLGNTSLAENALIYERIGKSQTAEIAYDEIRTTSIPASKILYSRQNYAGEIDLLVLDNATGNNYTYGIASVKSQEIFLPPPPAFGNEDPGKGNYITKRMLTIANGNTSIGPFEWSDLRSDEWGGIALNAEKTKIIASVKLSPIKNVQNNNWRDNETVVVDNQTYAVSQKVVCYNLQTNAWMSLANARAFASSMTLYVDDLGVVRGIEVR